MLIVWQPKSMLDMTEFWHTAKKEGRNHVLVTP